MKSPNKSLVKHFTIKHTTTNTYTQSPCVNGFQVVFWLSELAKCCVLATLYAYTDMALNENVLAFKCCLYLGAQSICM